MIYHYYITSDFDTWRHYFDDAKQILRDFRLHIQSAIDVDNVDFEANAR